MMAGIMMISYGLTMNMIKESPLEIDLYDRLGYVIQRGLFALAHPLSQLGKVQLVSRLLLLLEIFLKNDAQILQIRKNIVEGVTNHQQREDVV